MKLSRGLALTPARQWGRRHLRAWRDTELLLELRGPKSFDPLVFPTLPAGFREVRALALEKRMRRRFWARWE